MTDPTRGVLYPARLPTFHRLPAPPRVAHLVRWYWIPEWDLAPGRVSRQDIVSYPASNLVVEKDLVGLAGPTTRASHRDLTGRGWAVGALLRPAAVPAFTDDPTSLRDGYVALELPDLHDSVAAAMTAGGDGEQRRARAVDAFTVWLASHVGAVGDEALLANDLADVIEGVDVGVEVRRIEDVADRLGISPRTVQRLARKYVGVPPSAMIRRRRLQEAAERVRSEDADLSAVAADLGYADHAHLTKDFQAVLGFTPSAYRAEATERT
ncbi:MAG: helix-turn-helix transcriptional regulator [Micrococcales bacterium]|nr:helix-turn-helix transcriptional regulator [Micrococcales bacterium]